MGGPALLPGQQVPPQPEPVSLAPIAPEPPPSAQPSPPGEGSGHIESPAPPQNYDGATQQNQAAVEATAREQGWSPLSEWRGDPSHWRPAHEYIARGEHAAMPRHELVDRSAELDQLKGQVGNLVKLANRQFQAGIDVGLERAREQARIAVDNGDHEGASDAYAEIKRLEGERAELGDDVTQERSRLSEVKKAAAAFTLENRWMDTDDAARGLFDRLLTRYTPVDADGIPDVADHAAHLNRIKAMVREQLPESFGERRMGGGPGAMHGQQPGGASTTLSPQQTGAPSWDALPEDVRSVAQTFITQGAFGPVDTPEKQAAAKAKYAAEYRP